MFRNKKAFLPLIVVSLLLSAAAQAAETRSFHEARFEKGELKYINGLPVMVVEGTPEEIGRQEAALSGEAAKAIADYPRRLLRAFKVDDHWAKFVATGESLLEQAPADHRAELLAFGKALGIGHDVGVVANTIMDTQHGGLGCSSLLVLADKSATKSPLFGRNLDFYTLGVLDKYGLVTIHRPQGKKHAFASVGIPGVLGCLSGMNDAGLALAVHEVYSAADGSPSLNPKGMPYTFCFRRILEECSTVDEAEKLLRSVERSTMLNLAVCDRKEVGVLEITPKSVVRRHGKDGICACTNHFRSKELATWVWCRRYTSLLRSAAMDKIGVSDVAQKLDDVNQGTLTMQTMIFEPGPLLLHLSFGPVPSSRQPLKELSLKELFGK
jgi:hypothetical protein